MSVEARLAAIESRLAALEARMSSTEVYTRPIGQMQEVCPGCGVSVGQSCWDNCSLHPAFSQPKFLGNGRYEHNR